MKFIGAHSPHGCAPMLLSHKSALTWGVSLSITRPLRTFIALMMSAVLVTTSVGCGAQGKSCPVGTAMFPITGEVVKKSAPKPNCYLLHITRDDTTITETVRVNRYRYLHAELRVHVSYATEPTN